MEGTEDQCCSCVPEEADCKYKNNLYPIGSSWNDGTCMECSCDVDGGVVCNDLHDQCDVLQSCNLETHELKYSDSECCPTCVKKGSCTPVTITQQLFDEDGCVTEDEVDLSVCSGSCSSNTTMLQYPPYIQTNCQCCQPTEVEQRQVSAICAGKVKKTITIPVIKSCGCTGCDATNQ